MKRILVFTSIFLLFFTYSVYADTACAVRTLSQTRALPGVTSPPYDNVWLGENEDSSPDGLVTHVLYEYPKYELEFGISSTGRPGLNTVLPPSPDDGLIPLVLIHGWQGDNGLTNPVELITYTNSAEKYWDKFIEYFQNTPALKERYKLYLYKYPTYKHVTFNARILKELLDEIEYINSHIPVILAHSMGGLIARSLIEEHGYQNVATLITLATPHHGSPGAMKNWVDTGTAVEWAAWWGKDLDTPGNSDLFWDNYDGIMEWAQYDMSVTGDSRINEVADFDLHYRQKCIEEQLIPPSNPPPECGICPDDLITQTYPSALNSTHRFPNPWLTWLNEKLKLNGSPVPYIFYGGINETYGNAGQEDNNNIEDDTIFGMTTSFIYNKGYVNDCIVPVTSAFLDFEKHDKYREQGGGNPYLFEAIYPGTACSSGGCDCPESECKVALYKDELILPTSTFIYYTTIENQTPLIRFFKDFNHTRMYEDVIPSDFANSNVQLWYQNSSPLHIENNIAVEHPLFDTIQYDLTNITSTFLPPMPNLNSPDTTDPNHVSFSWSESSCENCGTVSYNLVIHDENADSIFIADRDTGQLIDNTSYTLPVPLEPNTTYYWAVFPKSEYGLWNIDVGDWSGFTTGSPCTLAITANDTFESSASSGSIVLTTQSHCGWEASSLAEWITIVSGPFGVGNAQITFNVAENTSTSSRSATVTINQQSVTITQAGFVPSVNTCSYSLSEYSNALSSYGGSSNFSIITNSGCDWSASSDASWIHITSSSIGDSSETITYTVDAFSEAGNRQGAITVEGMVYSITQTGVACTYGLSKASDTFNINGGVEYVDVVTPVGCSWNANTSDTWLEINKTSGSGPETITYVVRDYDGVDARSATLAVEGQAMSVTQAGVGCGGAGSSIIPQSAHYDESGGSGSVSVSAAADCTWSVTTEGWITIAPGDDIGTGNEVVNYTVQANPTNEVRTGHLSIAQQLFTITQDGVAFQSPTNLRVSEQFTNSFKVSWDYVEGATGYTLQKATDIGFSQNLEVFTLETLSTEPSKLISTAFGAYYFRVQAYNASVSSNWSSTLAFNWYSDIEPSITDNMLSPADDEEVGTNSINLSWSASGGNGTLLYTVYLADWAPTEQTPIVADTPSTTFPMTGLSYNETYYWKVKVVDEDGDEDWSNTVQFSILPESNPPSGSILVDNGAATTNSVSVTLHLSASDTEGEIVQMQFSNDGANWSSWGAYNALFPSWNLGDYGGSTNPGTKTVYARFKDNSGNISDISTDSITLEEGVPGNILLNGRYYASLRRAIDDAAPGETIYISAGWYDLTAEVNTSAYFDQSPNTNIGCALKDGVNLKGEGAEKTTLYWNDGAYGLVVNDNNTVEGLTLVRPTYPTHSRHTVMLAGSNSIIRNCILTGGDNPINTYAGSTNNYSDITIHNCLIYSNEGEVRLEYIGNLKFLNNVIYGSGYFGLVARQIDGEFRNNIITANQVGVSIMEYTGLSFSHNNLWGNSNYNYDTGATQLPDQTGTNGNISQDPDYADASNGDFSLSAGSPCIDAGFDVGLAYSGLPDMGAMEYGATGGLTITSNISADFVITMPDGSSQTISAPWAGTNLDIGIYGIYPQSYPGYYPPEIAFISINAEDTVTRDFVYAADEDGPVGELLINGGDYFSQSRYVTLINDVTDPVYGIGPSSQMQFSNDGVDWSAPEPISNKRLSWDLAAHGGNTASGIKTVYARYSDDGGNWSAAISDEIRYIPDGRTLVVPDAFSTVHAAAAEAVEGDIIYIRDGYHQLAQDLYIPSGVRIQGSDKHTTQIKPVYTYIPSNVTIDNITWINSPEIRLQGSENQIISNAIFDSSSYVSVYDHDVSARIRNSIFKSGGSTSYVYNFFGQNCDLKITNCVLDGSTNTSSGGTFTNGGVRLEIEGHTGNPFPVLENNIFYGFDHTGSTAISVYNDDETPGDLFVRHNNFFDSSTDLDGSGVPISLPHASTSVDPQFEDTQSYRLQATSLLAQSGRPELIFRDHDGSTNSVGIEGGPYYNTPPTAIAEAIPTHGGLNTVFTFSALMSTDEQTPKENLLVRWDFNGDGIFDTDYLRDLSVQYAFADYSDAAIVCWIFDEHFAISRTEIPNPTIHADSDNDGIPDRAEDANMNGIIDPGETDPYNADTDGDGINDGVELGYTLADIGPGTDPALFIADGDPSTTTLPLDPDTDGDGAVDGAEDTNGNGMVDNGEGDPADYVVIINSITPDYGCMGTQITIAGINFGDSSQSTRQVEFSTNVLAYDIVSWSDTEIICNVPSGASSGCLRVITNTGKSNCLGFTYQQPSAEFSGAITSGNFPLEVAFTDLSVCRINSWSWDFGDGTTSNEPNPTHTYNTPGTYSVRLTVAGAEGVNTISKYGYVQVFEPILSVTPTVQNIASSGGTLDYTVENTGTGTMPWAVSADVGWIAIDSGATGTDSGTISITVEENTGDLRSGQLTITSAGATGSPSVVEIQQDPGPGAGVSKIFSQDGEYADNFGYAVAADTNRLIVGAPDEDSIAYNSGSAYVFTMDDGTWVQQRKLNAADQASRDSFAQSVGISGDYAIIGSPSDDDHGSSSGSAYIFQYDGSDWVETAKLTASDAYASDRFGWSVAISGDRAIVGAYYNDDLGNSSGSAYIFQRNGVTWEQQPVLLPDDGAAGDRFGYSVSISGDVAVVGAFLDDDYGEDSGSAYVFRWNGSSWVQEQKLTPDETGADNDYFGRSVSVTGNYILVGSPGDDGAGTNEGAAYIYHYDGVSWVQQEKLTNNDGNTLDHFGTAVSITENHAIVGAQLDDENGSYAGAAYLFKRDGQTWQRQPKIVPQDAISGHYFGYSTAISNTSAFVGAFGDDNLGSYAGAVYAYELSQFEPVPPAAQFSGSPTSGIYPLEVSFTDTSTGDIDSWLWDFGDGSTSTDQNPTHTYSTPGTYSVILNVTGTGGADSLTRVDFIEVLEQQPVAEFTSDVQSGVAPLAVTFTDLSTGMITSWLWDLGDGNTSTDQHPIHTYGVPGLYSVSLTVTGPGGSNTQTKNSYINVSYPRPTAGFSASNTTGTTPLQVLFADESSGTITSWSWDFGDGGSSSYRDPSYVYSTAGTYVVSLTVAGPGGSDTVTKIDYVVVLGDADGDGLSDPIEAAGCTDQNNPDTDDDGILDGDEDANHNGTYDVGETDPCSDDTDGDGMIDGFEVSYGLDPLLDDSLEDFDSDGFCNLRESLSNTAPDDAMETPAILFDGDTDGDVDGSELLGLLQELGRTDCDSTSCGYDLDSNGAVDEIDLFLFGEDYGRRSLIAP